MLRKSPQDPEHAQEQEDNRLLRPLIPVLGATSTLTFHRRGKDDKVVIEELPVLNEGQTGVICGLEGELKAPV